MKATSLSRNVGVLLVLSLLTAAMAACETTGIKWAELETYEVRVIDNPTERQFDLILISNNSRKLCLTLAQWPNRLGQLHMGSTRAKVQTSIGVVPALDENFGYCPGGLPGCDYHRIEPYGQLRGYITYAAFNDPDALVADPNKQIEFAVYPFYCR